MPLPVSGAISFFDINVELGLAGTTQISLNDAAVRSLLEVPAGQISISSGYGKSSASISPADGGVLFILNQTAGIRGVGRSGYHFENVNYTDTINQGPFGPYTTLNITTFGTNISRLYRGYFFPAVTGNYRFRLTSDDGSYMWLGDNAISGYTVGNVIINNGGLHGAVTVTSNYWTMDANTFYPIRILYGNNASAGSINFEWEGPGQAFTNNGTNRYFYNSATNGF
jgi:hypothetical protein